MDLEGYDDYKLNDLFELLAILHGEDFPSAELIKKKGELKSMIADLLGIERKEVIWLVEAKEKKKLKMKMEEQERENGMARLNDRNWQALTKEVSTLVGQMTYLTNQIEEIKKATQKMEASYEQLAEKLPALEEQKKNCKYYFKKYNNS